MTNRSEYAPVECVNIPKMLFQEKQYEKLSVDAKLRYSLLLERKTLANMNGWIDQNGTAYVVYPKSEMKKHLNASRYRVDMALEELEKCGQMVVVTQPDPGKPCQIYVKDITGNHEKDMEENAMCMMMKDSNDKNKEPMMGPCMGIPGMHGVAIFFDPEEFMKAFEDEEKETDAKMEEDDSEAYSEEDEADEENIDYDYRDEAYYALPRKEQKMIDIINKTDADNEEPLKGVEFELRDSKGKVLEKLVTDAAGHAESGLYEIATYKNGGFGKTIKYNLVETKTLDGYTLDSTRHEIVFEYVDQNTPVMEVTKDLTNKEKQPEGNEAQPHDSGTTGRTSPKTGDNTNLWLPIVLMIGAAGLAGGILCGSKKKKKQNNQDKKAD